MKKVALITGCSSGFGLEAAELLAGRGWTVVGSCRKAGSRPDVYQGRALEPLALDVTDARERDGAARVLREKHGRLDCLIHNAGYGLFGALEDLAEEQFRDQLETNFMGAALLTRRLLPLLRESKGRILFVSSVLGSVGMPLASAYCASKFALEGLAESLRHELRPHGVQVGVVAPSGYRTRFSANSAWGRAALEPGSAYRGQVEGFRAKQRAMMAKPGRPPRLVAQKIADLAEARRLPPRTRLGADTHALHVFRKLAPEAVSNLVIDAIADKLYQAHAKA